MSTLGPTKDPMLKVSTPNVRQLFDKIGPQLTGVPADIVADIGCNLLINALRQTKKTRAEAERAYDEVVARAKGVLMNHYDGFGRKKGIFPYDQVIEVPLINLRGKR